MLLLLFLCCFYIAEDPTGANLREYAITDEGKPPKETVKSSKTCPAMLTAAINPGSPCVPVITSMDQRDSVRNGALCVCVCVCKPTF